jgi:hypothetical protein
MKGHYITKIDMTISNKGLSSAKDINLKAAYEPPFTQNEIIKGKVKTNICQLNELPIFRNGIPYLGPGNDICFNIGELDNENIQNNPLVKVVYSYKIETGQTIYRNIMIDLRYLRKLDSKFLAIED